MIALMRMHPSLAAVCAALPLVAGCPIYVVVEAEEDDPCADVTCGAYAVCVEGICECETGHVPDETSPEDCVAVQKVLVEDGCDDGRDIAFRLWSADRSWVWPGGTDVYWTVGYGLVTVAEIACPDGLTVCFGGASDGTQWGVGLDGDLPCDACCFDCFAGTVDLGVMVCGGGGVAPTPVAHATNGSIVALDSATAPEFVAGPRQAGDVGLDTDRGRWHVADGYEARVTAYPAKP